MSISSLAFRTSRLLPNEKRYIKKRVRRELTLVELGMLETMYSEHCSYKSSRALLRELLEIRSPRVLVGPGYDCGIVDIGGGWAVAFKIESHNHPSAIEPYNGAATGVGGIIRDILCVGARPIALLDSLRFGPLGSGRSRWLFGNVVKGIADYGNCVGIPTVAGEIEFDESFEENCLVNVACVGVVEKRKIILAELKKPGNLLVLAGGPTGRDGIHGVTFASKMLSLKSEEERAAVQVGDPFMKKLILEGVLEALATHCITGMKDLGGGGLACACSEMAARGGVGVEIEVSQVHVREPDMSPYEVMLSESQERMLMAVNPKGLNDVLEVLKKYDIPFSIIGRVTSTRRLVVKQKGETVAELEAELLAKAPPAPRKSRKPKIPFKALPFPDAPDDLSEIFLNLIGSPNIASKAWVFQQYDHEVGIRTVVKPGDGDAAVLRLPETGRALAVKVDGNSRHSSLDPFHGTAGVLAEGARNVVAVGGEPLAYADGCNFGNPERPEIFWQFKEAIRGLAYMSRSLGLPCVGGNVSFYNENEAARTQIKPTVVVVTLGLIENLDRITTLHLKEEGEAIILFGETLPELGGSEYLAAIYGLVGRSPPAVDGAREKRSIKAALHVIRKGLVTAAHDCSRGGLAVALAVMALKGMRGAHIELDRIPAKQVKRLDEILFSETHSRFILAAKKENVKKLLKIAASLKVPAAVIGTTVNEGTLRFTWKGKDVIKVGLEQMHERWKSGISSVMG